MSQPPRSPSPLTARLYDLEYPRSLGVYNTYQEVQSVVDTLADEQFPVQSTLIVGTDLKLMERVTGRRTWPKVISQGALSGLWMGLFLGLLLLLLSPGNLMVVLTAVVLGIVFFTVSSVIGYWMTGGQRDFTSMTATIPMQYELLVEHKHAAQAQRILAESGAAPAPMPAQHRAPYRDAPHGGGQQFGAPAPQPGAPSPSAASRPSYGQPAPSGPTQDQGPDRSGRPSFGMPAGAPMREDPTSGPTRHGSPSAGAPADEGTDGGRHPGAEQHGGSEQRAGAEQDPPQDRRPGDRPER